VNELVRKGMLRRAKDQPGVVAAMAPNGRKAAAKQVAKAPVTKAAPAKTAPTKAGRNQPPLREVLTELLQKSKRPLNGGELARQAQAAGYRSASKKFADVVWVALGKMDNVERVPGEGYRLKKR